MCPPPIAVRTPTHRFRVVRIHGYGGPEVLQFENLNAQPPAPGEVVISVKAIGLNRSEVLFREGRYIEAASFPARLGYEAAGTVTALGDGVAQLAVGDAVSVVPMSVTYPGTYAEFVTVPAEFLVPHSSTLSWVDAAASWMAHVTAYGGLVDAAGLTRGDYVVVLAASGAVGLAALGIARMFGATSIASTRSAQKRQTLFDAGADHVVVADEEDLAARVAKITRGEGARIVLDPVAGPGVEAAMDALSQHGVLVICGLLSGAPTPMPVASMIAKSITVRGYSFKEVVSDSDRRARAVSLITKGLASSELKPPPIWKVMPFGQIAEAHRYLESNEQVGKIVVTTDRQASQGGSASTG